VLLRPSCESPFHPALSPSPHREQALYREAKHGGVDDMDVNMAGNIMRKKRYKQDHDGDEEYDNDGGLDLVEKRDRLRGDAGRQAERQKQRQVKQPAETKRTPVPRHSCLAQHPSGQCLHQEARTAPGVPNMPSKLGRYQRHQCVCVFCSPKLCATDANRSCRNPMVQVADYKKFETMQQRCQLCMDSAARPKHLLIALGTAAYLMMPLTKRLMPGHCLIVPMQHCKATRMADETALTEIRNFKKCLIQMFAKQGKEVCEYVVSV
jgi:hypothetical protein